MHNYSGTAHFYRANIQIEQHLCNIKSRKSTNNEAYKQINIDRLPYLTERRIKPSPSDTPMIHNLIM